MNESQKKSIYWITQALTIISNEAIITECWNDNIIQMISSNTLPIDSICSIHFFNCRESLNILEDYYIYDLLEDNIGPFWLDYIHVLSSKTYIYLTEMAQELLNFVENENMDLDGDKLLENQYWKKIMRLSENALNSIKADLNWVN